MLIDDDNIVRVGKSIDAGDSFVIDGSNRTLMPGLIDVHVHLGSSCTVDFMNKMKDPTEVVTLRAISNARKTLKSGITTVRNAGEKNHLDTFVRDSIATGETSVLQ